MLMSTALALAPVLPMYVQLREQHPTVPARIVHRYVRDEEGLSFEQFVCAHTTGHSFAYTGTAYGGDDESFHGEGRCYCLRCGADGDA